MSQDELSQPVFRLMESFHYLCLRRNSEEMVFESIDMNIEVEVSPR